MRTALLLCCLALTSAAQDPGALRESMRAARARVFPCLVRIVNVEEVFSGGERRRSVTSGSGFFIDDKGHIVTNYHVAGQAQRLFVTLPSKRKIGAKLVAGDPYTDLAVVKVDPRKAFPEGNAPFAGFGDSDGLQEGDFVMAMGSPLSLARSVSFGIISCRDRLLGSMRLGGVETGKYNTWLQTDAAINPGNSGGPLVNLAGEVIGVNTRANIGANNLGFAIPSNVVKEVVAALMRHKAVPRSYLGLRLQPLDAVEDTLLGSVRDGVLVAAVDSGSPAARAGIQPGDFVTGLNGKPFSARFAEELPGLYRRISKLARDADATAKVLRREKTIEVKLRPVDLPSRVVQEREIKAWGITVRAITRKMALDQRLPDTTGVQVTGVRAGSAASGRLDVLDVIMTVQGKPIGGMDDFLARAGESVQRRDALVRLKLRRSSVDDVCALRPTYKKAEDR
ncbi:MAG: trypsin-like peptidase domain-containing protein [Planctomycetota bacterium]|jgi:serine protease Do